MTNEEKGKVYQKEYVEEHYRESFWPRRLNFFKKIFYNQVNIQVNIIVNNQVNNQVNVIFFILIWMNSYCPEKPVFDFPFMWELTQKPEQKNHLFLSICFLDFLWGIKERIWSIDCRMLELKRLSKTLLFTYLSLPMRKLCFCSWWKFFFVYCFSLEEVLC